MAQAPGNARPAVGSRCTEYGKNHSRVTRGGSRAGYLAIGALAQGSQEGGRNEDVLTRIVIGEHGAREREACVKSVELSGFSTDSWQTPRGDFEGILYDGPGAAKLKPGLSMSVLVAPDKTSFSSTYRGAAGPRQGLGLSSQILLQQTGWG
jgi:hypothetical protein